MNEIYGALLGGAIIGLSASLLLLCNGRIAGISGIVGGLISAATGPKAWRLAFVAGIILGPLALTLTTGQSGGPVTTPIWLLVPAGLLVGFGTRMGSGCTSGHGVCGLARRSLRSAVAVVTFMAAAVLTLVILRHGMGLI